MTCKVNLSLEAKPLGAKSDTGQFCPHIFLLLYLLDGAGI